MPEMNSKHEWTLKVFDAKGEGEGGIVRRSLQDVQKNGSLAVLKREAVKRGFHIIRAGDQLLVFCNKGDLRIVC
jgi:Trk K+ transport system NAD-binding subunit